MIIGNGELLDVMMNCAQLRLDYGITQDEIDGMMPFQFEMTKLMIVDIQKKRAQK